MAEPVSRKSEADRSADCGTCTADDVTNGTSDCSPSASAVSKGKDTPSQSQQLTKQSLCSHDPINPADDVESNPLTGAAHEPSSQESEVSDAYSIFTTSQKRLIVLTGSLCGFFSPVTASIYYPALQSIAKDLHVSNTAINLTVTTYLILQGIAPTFVGAFSDSAGRRPAFAYCFIVYIIANIGLGVQNSYRALIVLRCIQSAGSSGTIALANGVAADVVTAAERGSYIAISSLGNLLGPTIGPVIGGVISQYLGWHWIFWFLAILAGVFFVPLMLFFPETNRNVVGDGSYRPPLHCQSLTGLMIARNLKKKNIVPNPIEQRRLQEEYSVRFPNPLDTLTIACDKASFIILVGNGLVFAGLYAVLTGVSFLFTNIYEFDDIKIALCFLPFGIGSMASAVIVGRLVDWNYRRHAKRLGFPVIKNRVQNLDNFPLEKARLEIAVPFLWIGACIMIAYGWILHFRTALAAPLVVLFFSGMTMTGVYQALNIMLIDSYPQQAATATAANNLFRCLIGAVAISILGPLLNSWGSGWTYTFVALLWIVFSPALLLLTRYGPHWRRQRQAKEEARRLRRTKAKREGNKARRETILSDNATKV